MTFTFLLKNVRSVFIASCLFLFFVCPEISFLQAQDLTSDNFIVRDPIITVEGGRSTSSNFELFSSTGQLAPGQSTSDDFIYRAGFLYFPIANSPTLTATAGDSQVSLTWSASTGILANITDYQLGTSTTSGGSYTFESVGNVVSYTKTGLVNGTAYYFKVRAFAGTLQLAESAEVSATPVANAASSSSSGSFINFLLPPYFRPPPKFSSARADINKDGQVDLVDLSILLYHYNKSPGVQAPYDFNEDGKVDLIDISILMYYWTG